MPLITWTKEQHGTDVSFADEQHKKLFDLLNILHDVIPGGDKNAVTTNLDNLLNYVVEHFDEEERQMKEKNYSGFDEHKAQHDKLLADCGSLKNKFLAGEQEITTESTTFIKDWLDVHIPNTDRLYTPVLNG
ncbi:MAG: bacteriohemerythrin [Gammaproteobacteria bacterium]